MSTHWLRWSFYPSTWATKTSRTRIWRSSKLWTCTADLQGFLQLMDAFARMSHYFSCRSTKIVQKCTKLFKGNLRLFSPYNMWSSTIYLIDPLCHLCKHKPLQARCWTVCFSCSSRLLSWPELIFWSRTNKFWIFTDEFNVWSQHMRKIMFLSVLLISRQHLTKQEE